MYINTINNDIATRGTLTASLIQSILPGKTKKIILKLKSKYSLSSSFQSWSGLNVLTPLLTHSHFLHVWPDYSTHSLTHSLSLTHAFPAFSKWRLTDPSLLCRPPSSHLPAWLSLSLTTNNFVRHFPFFLLSPAAALEMHLKTHTYI